MEEKNICIYEENASEKRDYKWGSGGMGIEIRGIDTESFPTLENIITALRNMMGDFVVVSLPEYNGKIYKNILTLGEKQKKIKELTFHHHHSKYLQFLSGTEKRKTRTAAVRNDDFYEAFQTVLQEADIFHVRIFQAIKKERNFSPIPSFLSHKNIQKSKMKADIFQKIILHLREKNLLFENEWNLNELRLYDDRVAFHARTIPPEMNTEEKNGLLGVSFLRKKRRNTLVNRSDIPLL